MSATHVATIDIGTNSVLLCVARRGKDGEVETVLDRATITRIGRGVDETGALAPAGIEATLETLRDYVHQARELGAGAIAAVGTSALRDARNGDAFLEPARRVLGAPVEVISGLREARLTFRGALQGVQLGGGEHTVVDVGGGSTELVHGVGRRVKAEVSLNVGSVRLFERHVRHDPPRDEELARVTSEAREALASAAVPIVPPPVGIAGTVTTLSAMLQELDRYDPERIHGSRIARADLDDLIARLCTRTTEERASLPGLDPRRADVILPGAILVREIIALSGGDAMVVSNGGVRLGLADELLD